MRDPEGAPCYQSRRQAGAHVSLSSAWRVARTISLSCFLPIVMCTASGEQASGFVPSSYTTVHWSTPSADRLVVRAIAAFPRSGWRDECTRASIPMWPTVRPSLAPGPQDSVLASIPPLGSFRTQPPPRVRTFQISIRKYGSIAASTVSVNGVPVKSQIARAILWAASLDIVRGNILSRRAVFSASALASRSVARASSCAAMVDTRYASAERTLAASVALSASASRLLDRRRSSPPQAPARALSNTSKNTPAATIRSAITGKTRSGQVPYGGLAIATPTSTASPRKTMPPLRNARVSPRPSASSRTPSLALVTLFRKRGENNIRHFAEGIAIGAFIFGALTLLAWLFVR